MGIIWKEKFFFFVVVRSFFQWFYFPYFFFLLKGIFFRDYTPEGLLCDWFLNICIFTRTYGTKFHWFSTKDLRRRRTTGNTLKLCSIGASSCQILSADFRSALCDKNFRSIWRLISVESCVKIILHSYCFTSANTCALGIWVTLSTSDDFNRLPRESNSITPPWKQALPRNFQAYCPRNFIEISS